MTFKLALAQYPITRHSSWKSWQEHCETWVKKGAAQAQILVFPEFGAMELCSLMTEPEQKEIRLQIAAMDSVKEKFLQEYSRLAIQYGVYILAPALPVLNENQRRVCRAYFFSPRGNVDYQDKLRASRFDSEQAGMLAGEPQGKVFATDLGNLSVNICYDIEFPDLALVMAKAGTHVLLNPSCTDTSQGLHRVHIGARARALENQVIVGVSQVVGAAPWALSVQSNIGQAAVYVAPDGSFPEDGILNRGPVNQIQWLFQEVDPRWVEQLRTQGRVFNYRSELSTPVFQAQKLSL